MRGRERMTKHRSHALGPRYAQDVLPVKAVPVPANEEIEIDQPEQAAVTMSMDMDSQVH